MMRRQLHLWSQSGAAIVLLGIGVGAEAQIPAAPTSGEMRMKAEWVQAHLQGDQPRLPFSFILGGRSSAEVLKSVPARTVTMRLDAARTQHVFTWVLAQAGLKIRCVAVEYDDFPAVEWTVYLKNAGTQDTPLIESILGIDVTMERRPEGEFVLHHWKGDTFAADLYQPLEQVLAPGQSARFAPAGGRGSNGAFPYYNLAIPGGGLMIAVGWPGQWSSSFTRDAGRGLRITAGQDLTHMVLKSGEEVRTPLCALLFWQGESLVRAQNLWRRWMWAHNVPRTADGNVPAPKLFGNTSQEFNEMCNANEENQNHFIDRYIQERVPINYWWMDAGWYPCGGQWPKTGTWEPDLQRFPRGLRAISDHAQASGVKTLVWFEPERVAGGTWLAEHHPEWLLGGTLFNLGRPEARIWLTDHVDRVLREQRIALYRQDFNMDPLPYWRKNDPPDRQGVTENLHVQGYLAYWDELRRHHPDLTIDSCASGGRRNDLETMRRAIALHPTDYNYADLTAKQAFHASLFQWLPCFGSNTVPVETVSSYAFRSGHALNVVLGYDLRRKELDYDLLRRLAAEWQQIAPYYRGDFYPLTPYNRDDGRWIAWQFDRPERGDGVVETFRREKAEAVITCRLSAVDPSATYSLENLDSGATWTAAGSDLRERGVRIEEPEKPGAVAIRYTRGKALSQPRAMDVPSPRRVIDLNGVWDAEQGGMDTVPAAFRHTVPVPGLLDMAQPSFRDVGKVSSARRAFWYRRIVKVTGPVPEVALLKLHKARYGTKVWLNGNDLGEHQPCFTPGYFDLKPFLKGNGAENELIIRVGANPECLPSDMPRGWDFEKYLYLPGLYDSVELILAGTPFIKNVQVVPDIASGTARAVVELQAGSQPAEASLSAIVREARSGAAVRDSATTSNARQVAARQTISVELPMRIPGARLWSPEDPFLYEAEIATGGDAVKVRFGMRSFRFDRQSGRAELNGKPYFMRGTNVCINRFFEDADRGDRPWRLEWVRRLHEAFKSMHWNSIRYCIGFPPDSWYDIADEVGFLIQDEFPIWLLNPGSTRDAAPESPRAEKIIPQYVEWMRERWNHPCVVIWDAQNESFTDETGKAIRAVRHLDLSGRPWDNGWSEPQSPTDCVESHPYLFIRSWQGGKPFRFSEMPGVSGIPHLNDRQQKMPLPIIINEYCWLWLNRDGTPTCLTKPVYESLLGPGSTLVQRRELHARSVAALTEFWRCHRVCAGVLHFCGLGYSRPGDKPRPEGGATSDHWIDLERLVFEPTFESYVRDAFSPIGLMLDFWADAVPAGSEQSVKVYVINDLEASWNGEVRLSLMKDAERLRTRSAKTHLPGFGREIVAMPVAMPMATGDYLLRAELVRGTEPPVRSRRDFKVVGQSGAH
jgi:hypothetical protein